jgi:hypothetical protein
LRDYAANLRHPWFVSSQCKGNGTLSISFVRAFAVDRRTFDEPAQEILVVAASTGSINVPSSASAFELLTRFDTGQRCR